MSLVSNYLDGYQEGTVYINPTSGAATCKLGTMDKVNGTAFGYYNNTLNQTGWGILELHSQCEACRNTDVMFAAGFLEGVLTARYALKVVSGRCKNALRHMMLVA
jgi:Phospholipase B